VILRSITAGETVHSAAIVFDQHEMLTFADVLRTLEHHVLEQMGKARAPIALVARAGVIGTAIEYVGAA